MCNSWGHLDKPVVLEVVRMRPHDQRQRVQLSIVLTVAEWATWDMKLSWAERNKKILWQISGRWIGQNYTYYIVGELAIRYWFCCRCRCYSWALNCMFLGNNYNTYNYTVKQNKFLWFSVIFLLVPVTLIVKFLEAFSMDYSHFLNFSLFLTIYKPTQQQVLMILS